MIKMSFGGNAKKKNSIGKMPFRYVAVLVLVIVFVLGSALTKELYREYRIKKDIDALKAQISSMQKDNYQLSQLIGYYQTDQFKEAEARRRLNLKADGEKVVMIDDAKKSYEETQQSEEAKKKESVPNHQKWWNYFFASRG